MGTLHLRINGPGTAVRTFDLPPGVYTIGSEEDNAVVLPGKDVAWRHAVLDFSSSGASIEALAAVTLGDSPVHGRQSWQAGQVLNIGAWKLVHGSEAPSAAPPVEPGPRPAARSAAPAGENRREREEQAAQRERLRSIKRQVQEELLERLDIKRLTASRVEQQDLQDRARHAIRQIVAEIRDRLPPGIDPAALIKDVHDEALGLGPLEDLLEDDDVTEIMVNGADRIYVERSGRIEPTGRSFVDDDSVLAVVERIVAPIGRRVDESQPYVDARLPDGSRVNVIISPLSLSGPCMTIRKFSRNPLTMDDLVSYNTLDRRLVEFLQSCVQLRKNIVVSGGTGSGKTTLLNVISAFLPGDERIVTIEDAAELRMTQEHVIRLESRPPNIEGRGAVTIRDLVRNALRMRPDRIVVGECRGGEALDMLQAMNTGHEGSLTTVHANAPRDVISRLETMVLMSGMELPLRAVREQIGAAIHLIVHTARYSDGSRKVSRVSEVVGLEGDQITMQDLFFYEQQGVGEDGRVIGAFRATGGVPTFLDELEARGLKLDRSVFDPQDWSEK